MIKSFKMFEENGSYTNYNEGDIVTYINSLWVAGPNLQIGRTPSENGSGWTKSSSGDITGIAITADAGLTGTMKTTDGFHFQDITIATGGITTAHIADNAITSSKIADGAILGVDVATGVTLIQPDITGDAEVFGNVFITGTAAAALDSDETSNPVIKVMGANRRLAIDCGQGGISAQATMSTFQQIEIRSASVNSGNPQVMINTSGVSATSSLCAIRGFTGEFTELIAVNGISTPGITLEEGTSPSSIKYNEFLLGSGFNLRGTTGTDYFVKLRRTGISFNDAAEDIGFTVKGDNDTALIRTFPSSDRVGIGTASASDKLDVFGSIRALGVTLHGSLDSTGLIKGNTGEFNQVVAISGISCGGNIIVRENATIGLDGAEKITFHNDYIQLNADDVQTRGKISHLGDSNTFIKFHPDELMFQAGGATLAHGTGGILQVPVGISAEGATFGGDVIIDRGIDGDAKLIIKADTDNNDENDNPLIRLEQDGGVVSTSIGMVGDADGQFSGALANMFYIEADGSAGNNTHGIQFATANTARMTIDPNGNVGIQQKVPGATLDVIGNIFASTGISSGGPIYCQDNLVSRPELKDFAETVNAIGSVNSNTAVNFESGNVQTVTIAGNCEFSFSNPPASGKAGTVTLIITNGGSSTVTYHSSVKWPSDVAPSLTSSGIDIITFLTTDAGSNIYGFVGGLNFS